MRKGLRRLLLGVGVALLAAVGVGGLVFVLVRPATSGGKVLTYEVKGGELPPEKMEELAAQLKERLDPDGTRHVIIRPDGRSRVEIAVPYFGAGDGQYLSDVRDMVRQTGLLEFRILANPEDDAEAIAETRRLLDDPTEQDRAALNQAAEQGLPPLATTGRFRVKANGDEELVGYVWVELGKEERESYGLSESYAEVGKTSRGRDGEPYTTFVFDEVAKTRGKTYPLHWSDRGGSLLYSRDTQRPADLADGKKVDYFFLARESPADVLAVNGNVRLTAGVTGDSNGEPAVAFQFVSGAERFAELTKRNRPSGDFQRELAVIIDGKVVSAPRLRDTLCGRGQVSGNFDFRSAKRLASILNAGCLCAELKPDPVSETPLDAAGEARVSASTAASAARTGLIWAAAAFVLVLIGWLMVCVQLGRLAAARSK